MPIELAISLVTLGIATIGVVVYLWVSGASLLLTMEIHNLRVETHQLRLDYAKRIAAMSGESDVDIVLEGAEPGQPAEGLGDAAVEGPAAVASIAPPQGESRAAA